jgi:hypothetical protein
MMIDDFSLHMKCINFICYNTFFLIHLFYSVPKYLWPKSVGTIGCISEVKISTSGYWLLTASRPFGVENRQSNIMLFSVTPCSFSILIAKFIVDPVAMFFLIWVKIDF